MNKKKETKEKSGYDEFVDFVVEKWKPKVKDKSKFNEKETREYIDIMLFLMDGYRLKCLLGTIIDLSDLMEEWTGERCD